MSQARDPRLEIVSMVLISALLFILLFRLNDWLFSALEHNEGVNWIFLPGGFRVLLVLVLGVPGAMGIVLANLWLDHDRLAITTWPLTVMIGLASGFGPWLVRAWMEKRGLLDRELRRITSAKLLHFVLLYAAINAISHQLIHWTFGTPDTLPWVDVWPMFIGDTIGALMVLYAFKVVLAQLRRASAPRA